MRSTWITSGSMPLRLSAMRTRKVASERQNEKSFMGHSVRRTEYGRRRTDHTLTLSAVCRLLSVLCCVNLRIEAVRRPPAGEKGKDVVDYDVRHLLPQLDDGAAEVRRKHHVVHDEKFRLDERLALEHVEARASDAALGKRADEGRLIDHGAARGIDEKRASFHQRELARAPRGVGSPRARAHGSRRSPIP